MAQLGFDATVLGNHEFDYRADGATDMLNAAVASGEPLPAITLSNVDWDRTLAHERRGPIARELRTAMDRYGVADYLIIERGGVRAAIFGLMGKQADSYAPESSLYFLDQAETARAMVARIRAEANADIIICLSHSGLRGDPGRSEDELLANAVQGIDVIISGHSHTRLPEPIVIGDTIIVGGGSYTNHIGHLLIARDGNRYRVTGYEMIPISADLPMDEEIAEAISGYRELVETRFLSNYGFGFDDVLSYSPFSFTPERFGGGQGEYRLGNLIADSYIHAVRMVEGSNYRNVDVAIAPSGVIRGSFDVGPISVTDAFNVSSLGIGPDKIPGYPLVSLYLTGRELKTVAEIDISVSPMMSAARLFASGLTYTYNPNRLILNRVTSVRLMDLEGNISELENDRLYRVVGGLYSCQMLGAVEGMSYGLLKVTPKDVNGNPIADFEEHIIYYQGSELKEWVALANYLASFDPVNGIPTIPEYYNQYHGRKIEEASWSPIALLKNPNMIFFLVLGVVLLVLAIIIVPTVLIVRKVRKVRRSRS